MKLFKAHPSQSGLLMTSPKSKADKEAGNLSQTTKTYLQEWVKEQLYGRRKDISNKYIEKGLIVEDNSIDFLIEQLELPFNTKNEKLFENDFMIGTPDLIFDDLVIDVKNSFDCFTFPLFENDIPTKAYYYQLQCYMALTGKSKAKLVYTLMDTPKHLIESETWKQIRGGNNEDFELLFPEVEAKMTYSNIEDKLRIKSFDIERNDSVIKDIEQRVLKCRKYINELLKSL